MYSELTMVSLGAAEAIASETIVNDDRRSSLVGNNSSCLVGRSCCRKTIKEGFYDRIHLVETGPSNKEHDGRRVDFFVFLFWVPRKRKETGPLFVWTQSSSLLRCLLQTRRGPDAWRWLLLEGPDSMDYTRSLYTSVPHSLKTYGQGEKEERGKNVL